MVKEEILPTGSSLTKDFYGTAWGGSTHDAVALPRVVSMLVNNAVYNEKGRMSPGDRQSMTGALWPRDDVVSGYEIF